MIGITPIEIEQVEFKKSFRGYDEVEVNRFLTEIAEGFKLLIEDNSDLRNDISLLKSQMERYKNIEEQMQNSLLSLHTIEEDRKKNSEKEAELIIKNSELEAEKIIHNAKNSLMNLRQDIIGLKGKKIDFIRDMQALIRKHNDYLELELDDDREGLEKVNF